MEAPNLSGLGESKTLNPSLVWEVRPISVVVVDDHDIARHIIRNVVTADHGIEVIGEAETAAQAISLVCALNPDVVTLDVRLRRGNGIQVAQAMATKGCSTKILVFSAYDNDQYIKSFLRLGARGYLVKDAKPQQLIRAIYEVAHGGLVFGPTVADQLLRRFGNNLEHSISSSGSTEKLSSRENEVLTHISQGLRNQEIADRLGIAPRTVESHVQHLLRKLGARSRTEATLMAIRDQIAQDAKGHSLATGESSNDYV